MDSGRILKVALVGGGVSAAAFGLTRVSRGLPEAAFFMAALLGFCLTLGLIVSGLDDRIAAARMQRGDRCVWCHRVMKPLGAIRVCPTCDGSVV